MTSVERRSKQASTVQEPASSEDGEEAAWSSEEPTSSFGFPCLWSSSSSSSFCFKKKYEEGKFRNNDRQNQERKVITSETDIARMSASLPRSPRTVFVRKQLSTSSIGSSLSHDSERSRRSGDSHVSLYQKVLDQFSMPWHFQSKPVEEMSAFPSQQWRQRIPDLQEFSKKDGQRLFMWSPNIGMVSFAVKNQSTISC